ncbi:hypothetical protein [Planomonospora parontospora]|uniref:hypothetical protein n=1 Tax=Planomonospora parontospora TaxID=58119 RepID=UPI00178676A8|nr:hypothetical protein [Planomonospora parontospora]
MIAQLLHSHARTRAHAIELLGRHGTIVRLLRRGAFALVELDQKPSPFLDGVRCWHLHLDDLLVDDLLVDAVEPPHEDRNPYGVGLSGVGREVVRHAWPSGRWEGLCGATVRPVLIGSWSPPFLSTVENACPACVCLAGNDGTGS